MKDLEFTSCVDFRHGICDLWKCLAKSLDAFEVKFSKGKLLESQRINLENLPMVNLITKFDYWNLFGF